MTVSVPGITAIADTASPGLAQAYWLAGFGAVLLFAAPVIARVPEHRGSR